MDENIINQIKEAGLEPKEAEIYLAVLGLGRATVLDIAKKSRVKRTTIYQYLDNLIKNRLLLKSVKGKRIFYIAEEPEKLLRVLENKKKKVNAILPELQKLYSVSFHKPKIRFYEGIEGMRTIYDEMTKTSHIIYGVFSADKYWAVFNEDDDKKFFANIREQGGQIKDLVEDTPLGRKHIKGERYKGIGVPKLLPKGFEVAVDLMVAGDKVAMLSLVNLVGVMIENPEIAELQRNFVKFLRKKV